MKTTFLTHCGSQRWAGIITGAVALQVLLGVHAVLADHGSRKEEVLQDGGLVISQSFNRNLFIYRSVGGKTEVKGQERKRKWWCAWLCKRRVPLEAESISVQNTYFSEISPDVFEVQVREARVCTEASSCQQRESAFGRLMELELEGGELLPLHGVVTQHRTVIGGMPPIEFVTSKGKHPGLIID